MDAGDYEKAYSYYTPNFVEEMEKQGVSAEDFNNTDGQNDGIKNQTVSYVTVGLGSNTATATASWVLETDDGQTIRDQTTWDLVKQGGQWKFDAASTS